MPIVAAIVGVVGAVGSAALASSMAPDASGGASFAPRDLYREITDTLRAQEETAQRSYELKTKYDPLYGEQQIRSLDQILRGTPSGRRMVGYKESQEVVTPGTEKWTAPNGVSYTREQMQDFGSTPAQLEAGQPITKNGLTYTKTGAPAVYRTMQVPEYIEGVATPGLLELYEKEYGPASSRIQAQSRRAQLEGEFDDLDAFAPRYYSALQAANPRTAGVLSSLYADAQEGLEAGTDLTPFESRNLQQYIRQGQTARGLGYGTGDAAAEAFYTAQGANARKRERQGFAQGVLALDQSIYGNPFQAVLGRSNATVPLASSLFGSAQSVAGQSGSPSFDPFNAYAGDLYSSNQNAAAAGAQSAANMNAANFAGAAKIGGSVFDSLFKGVSDYRKANT